MNYLMIRMKAIKLPSKLPLGISQSGFQFEMGVKGSEDRNSDWWVWTHDPDNIALGIVSGDLPENGPGYWDLYHVDHDIMEWLGVEILRIGIEWSRIFPKPTYEVSVDYELKGNSLVYVDVKESSLRKLDELANRTAVRRYREIVSDWKRRGKVLIVNLNHFTLPIWIHDPLRPRYHGLNDFDKWPSGWLNVRSAIEYVKYAAYVAWSLSDMVDMWSTFNEPIAYLTASYINPYKGFPPGIFSPNAFTTGFLNIIQAHARAYEVLKELTGKPIGIIHVMPYIMGLNGGGDYVERAKYLLNFSLLESLINGRLLNGEVRDDLRGKVDWLGLNYYTRLVVSDSRSWLRFRPIKGYGALCRCMDRSLEGRIVADNGWEVYPEGLYHVLKETYLRYGLPIYITENGVADEEDRIRPNFILSHIEQVSKAISEGVDVKAYMYWSLVDNYEWAQGFKMKFGLFKVNHRTKERIPRPSAYVFRSLAKAK